jgi:hypothetical protein
MVHVGSSVRDMSQICFDKYDVVILIYLRKKKQYFFRFREHMAGVHGEKDFHFDHGHAHPDVAAAAPPPPR